MWMFLQRLLDLTRRRRRDAHLAEDVETHLALLADDYERRGLTPDEARSAARRAFGGVDQVKSLCRDVGGFPVLDAVAQDVRFATRLLIRERGFALTAILVLGLGIGVNNMLFSIFYAHNLRGLPAEQPDRVLYIAMLDAGGVDRGLSYPDFDDLRRSARTFNGMAAYVNAPIGIGDEGRAPERRDGAYLSANAFGVIGVAPVRGRVFTDDEDRPGGPAVAVLGAGVWEARYGADPAMVGRTIVVEGVPVTVIGVVPDRSGFPSPAQVWLPLSRWPGLARTTRDARPLRVVARVRDGVEVSTARAEVEAIVDGLAAAHPATNRGVRANLFSINERMLGRRIDPAWLAFVSVSVLIALISCANVANLMLSRAVHRASEIAIRTSLGASRRRIVGQLLIESALLAAGGGVVGMVVALAGVRSFANAIPANLMPYWFDYTMDARVFAALVGVSVAAVFLCGIVPALQASKTDVTAVINDGGRSTIGRRAARRWTGTFLIVEIGLAVVMLANTVLSIRSSSPELPSDAVIDTPEVLTASIGLPADRYPSSADRATFYRRLEERLNALPGVRSAAVASALPLTGAAERRLEVSGRSVTSDDGAPAVGAVFVGPRYFETLGLGLVKGRGAVERAGSSDEIEGVINERVAELYFGGREPLGEPFTLTVPPPTKAPPAKIAVAGVAPIIRQRSAIRGRVPVFEPIVYLPYDLAPAGPVALVVRGRSTPTSAVAALVKDEVRALDPHVPVYRTMTLAQAIDDADWNGRVSRALIVVLTAIAVLLSTVGLYAVTAHAVSLERREIAVRMALGAKGRQVRLLVVRRTLWHVGLGLAAGTVGVLAWSRVFAAESPGLRLTDPVSLVLVSLALLVVAALASFIPARRATRLDPVAALRDA